jgi:polyisoprenoid-binding protein YceI
MRDRRPRHPRSLSLLVLLAFLPATAALAEPHTLPLDPAHAEVGFRAYALGLVPIDGSFSRFSGQLTFDSAFPAQCSVEVRVDVASLQIGDAAMQADVLSPNLLDAAAFPTLTYRGACRGDVIEGTLTMHGTARPLSLSVQTTGGRYNAEAAMRRRDWGIVGRPLLAGGTVRIRVSTPISGGQNPTP